jgi:hypothetical protein
MANNVAVIVECRGPIMANTLTRLNALTAAMYMEQIGLICMRESALSVKKGQLESGIGGLSRNEIVSQRWGGRQSGWFPLWQSEIENSPSLKRRKRRVDGKSL